MFLRAAIVFAAMFALDFIWAKYTYALTRRQPLGASTGAVGIVLANSVVTLGYVSDPWMIVPAALGAFAGTWAAVRFDGEKTPSTFRVPAPRSDPNTVRSSKLSVHARPELLIRPYD